MTGVGGGVKAGSNTHCKKQPLSSPRARFTIGQQHNAFVLVGIRLGSRLYKELKNQICVISKLFFSTVSVV